MPADTFFGGSGTGDLAIGGNFIYFFKATATATGDVTEGKVYWKSGSANIKLAVYSDAAGVPGTLLGVSDVIALSGGVGFKTAAYATPFAVTNGTPYWLAWISNTTPTLGGDTGPDNFMYLASTYPTFPSSGAGAGTGGPNRGGLQAGVTSAPSATTPVADFSATPTLGPPSLNVTFTDLSTNSPTSWAWDFGDSGTSTAQNPSHSYTVAGTYTVTLVATNTAGSDTETKVGYVSVAVPQPEGIFLIGFDAPVMEPDPTWTRIDTLDGCRVRGYSIDRGRPTEFDKTDVGTAVVRIVDRAGLFDPTNASSPYVGKILPGKQATIGLQNPVNDTWHTLFRGYIESWRYALDQTEQYMELELQLVDGFAILARAELEVLEDGVIPGPPPYTSPPYATLAEAEREQVLAGFAKGNVLYGETETGLGTGTLSDRIQAVLEDVDWPDELKVQAVDIFSGNVRVGPKAYGPGTSALDALWDCVDAEFPGVANLYMSRDGHVTFRGRQARFRPDVAEYNITRYTVADPSVWGDFMADPLHEVVPVAELEWSNGQDNLFNAASATPQWIGTGSAIRQINPGDPSYDDVAGQYVKDQDSIDAYGLRSITFDNLQTVEGIATGNNSMVETRRFAEYYVTNFKDPAPRVSRIVFKAHRPGDTHGSAWWQFVCNVEISDLLTLKTTHPGGGGFDHELFVEGIHYTGRPGSPDIPQIVDLTLDLSPRANWDTNVFDEDEDP